MWFCRCRRVWEIRRSHLRPWKQYPHRHKVLPREPTFESFNAYLRTYSWRQSVFTAYVSLPSPILLEEHHSSRAFYSVRWSHANHPNRNSDSRWTDEVYRQDDNLSWLQDALTCEQQRQGWQECGLQQLPTPNWRTVSKTSYHYFWLASPVLSVVDSMPTLSGLVASGMPLLFMMNRSLGLS